MAAAKGYDYKKTVVSVTGLVVLFFVLVLLNIIASYATVRWDATEDNAYSLSDGTRNILSSLTQSIVIKFFYSRSNPDIPANIKVYARHVEDFLSEYRNAAKGKIKVELVDPKPDSDEEEWAQKYGVQPMRGPKGNIYCGLVFLSLDREEVIPWLDPGKETTLEYDLTSTIVGVQTTQKKVVGVITGLPVFGMRGRAMPDQGRGEEWLFITEMKKIYQIQEISPTVREIDPAIDLLMVVYPKQLSPRLQYAIDQYVLGGGNALIFVDPLCVSDREGGQQPFMRSSGESLNKLFAAWGVSMTSGKAVADFGHPTRVRSMTGGTEDNPLMISARGDSFNRKNVVTAGLESMLLPVAGSIEKVKDATCDLEPLVTSSTNAALTESFNAFLGVEAVKKGFVPAGKPFNLAVRVRGTFKSAFPDGPPKEEESPSKSPPEPLKRTHLKESEKVATLIIVSDADMLADQYYVQRGNIFGLAISEMFNDNLNFLSNTAEILTGSEELIGLRSRGKMERPFTAVLELKQRAQERWLSKEKELVQRVEETNQKLRRLEQEKDRSQKMILSPEQEAEIARFKEERQKINRELKEVRRNLRADIERLGTALKVINIFLMPLLVSVAGIVFAVYKQRRVRKQ